MKHPKSDIKSAVGELKSSGIDIRRLGDTTIDDTVDVIPSRSLALDVAIGVGGYPRGRIIEMFGPESGGKSTLTYLGMASCQHIGGTAALIDLENSFNVKWARSLGVNVDDLYMVQPGYAEQALDAVVELARANVDIIVIDSTAALVPKEVMEGSLEKNQMALLARTMSKGLQKITNIKTTSVIIFINQLREKVGVMWGSPEDTPGGRALKFYSTLRIRVAKVSKSEKYNEHNEPTGHRVKFKIVKNKVGPPLREGEFYLSYTKGIKRSEEVFTIGTKLGIIEVTGRTYSYGDNKWNGQEKCREALRTNKPMRQEIAKLIRAQILT